MADDNANTLDAWWAEQPPVITKPQHFQPSPWDALMQRLIAIEQRLAALDHVEARLAALEAKGGK